MQWWLEGSNETIDHMKVNHRPFNNKWKEYEVHCIVELHESGTNCLWITNSAIALCRRASAEYVFLCPLHFCPYLRVCALVLVGGGRIIAFYFLHSIENVNVCNILYYNNHYSNAMTQKEPNPWQHGHFIAPLVFLLWQLEFTCAQTNDK